MKRKIDSAGYKTVLIIGGGFAGLNCAQRLASDASLRITLIDKNNYQQFQPLLYQVATGLLSSENAAFNLRDVLRKHENVQVVLTEIESIDLEARTAIGKEGNVYQGDYLVLAAGSEANFFATPGASSFAFPMYSLQDAERLRSGLLELLGKANLKTSDPDAGYMRIAVIGGGPTGVETAGAIADILRDTPKHLYPNLDLTKLAVTLVDKGSKLLPPFTSESQEYAAKVLQDRGVELRLGTAVSRVSETQLFLTDGSRLHTNLVIWAGGLKPAPLSNSLGIKLGRGGRVVVQPDLTVSGYVGVYAIGDFATLNDADGQPLPQLASVAQQAGRHCAKNIAAAASGKEQTPFQYFDKGIMAMVGRNAAVAELGPGHHAITGVLAFAAWLGVHAVLLTTVRAKVSAFLEWAWDYFGSAHVSSILDQPAISWAPGLHGKEIGDHDIVAQ